MKKGELLNSEISYVIAEMGHTDTLTISDCGFPIRGSAKRIDLALKFEIPTFIDTLKVVLSEQCIQRAILAEEIKTTSPEMLKEIKKIIGNIPIDYVSHETLKKMSESSKAVIRTGECTSYANIILESGVTF